MVVGSTDRTRYRLPLGDPVVVTNVLARPSRFKSRRRINSATRVVLTSPTSPQSSIMRLRAAVYVTETTVRYAREPLGPPLSIVARVRRAGGGALEHICTVNRSTNAHYKHPHAQTHVHS